MENTRDTHTASVHGVSAPRQTDRIRLEQPQAGAQTAYA